MDTHIGDSGVRIADIFTSPVKSTVDIYQWIFSYSDPRVDSWPLMGSPFPTVAIFATYLLITKYGPQYMSTREPFKFKWTLVFYNMFITLLNGWMALELCWCAYQRGYNLVCQLVDVSDNEYELRIANVVWWYYVSKSMEFMDTFFFIMRKKENQLSFLHIYHHSTMFCVWWAGTRFVPGGSVDRRDGQLLRPRADVLLLRARCPRPAHAKVPLVEEVPHHDSARPIRGRRHRGHPFDC